MCKILIKYPLKYAEMLESNARYSIEVIEKYFEDTENIDVIDISGDGKLSLIAKKDHTYTLKSANELEALKDSENMNMLLECVTPNGEKHLLAITGLILFIRTDDNERLEDINDFDIHKLKNIGAISKRI